MKFNNLTILKDKELIRSIDFRNGLNLITNKLKPNETGNGVGKSTLSRVIDYLFGANITVIYSEQEYNQANNIIKNFFEENNVIAILKLTDINNKIVTISKTLSNNENEIKYFINGTVTDKRKYYEFINLNLFNLTSKSPKLREVLPKFIRNNSYRIQSTTNFLDKFTNNNNYLEIYLYLFGFTDLDLIEKNRLANNTALKKAKTKTAINSLVAEKKPKNELQLLRNQLVPLEKSFQNLNFENQEISPLTILSKIQQKVEKLIIDTLKIETNINNINQTIENIKNSNKIYLNEELIEIYNYANINISSPLQTLDKAVVFHNILVSRKIDFLMLDLPRLVIKKTKNVEKIKALELDKNAIMNKLSSKDNIEKAQKLLKDIGDIRNKMGELEGLLKNQAEAAKAFNDAKATHLAILTQINQNLKSVNEFSSVLESKFISIIKEIYNLANIPNFKINLIFDKNKLKLEITNNLANPEGGMKKAEVIAFDLAYIQTVTSQKVKLPKFVIHDAIEDIDNQQIEKLFDISNNLVDGQQIVSLLSDKLDDNLRIKFQDSIILELSQSNKFFKI